MKKKTSANTPSISGIELKDSISIAVKRQESIFKSIPLIIVAFLGVFGTVYTFLSFFEFHYDKTSVVFFTTVFFVVTATIFLLPKKAWFTLIPLTLLYEVLFIKYRDIYILGYKVVYNIITERLKITGRGMQYYKIDANVDTLAVTTIFIIFSVFLLALIISYISVVNNNFLLGFLVTFPFAEIGLYYGLIPNTFAFVMLIIFWITLFAMQLAGYRHYHNGTAGFVRKDNNFIAKYNIKFKVTETTAVTIIMITALSILISMMSFNLLSDEKTQQINQTRAELKTAVKEFSIDDITENFLLLPTSLGNGTTKNTGKLGQYNSVNFKNKVDLTVKLNGNPYQTLYLKGYTGSVYTNDAWKEMSKSDQKQYADIFEDMRHSGNYSQRMLGLAMSSVNPMNSDALSSIFGNVKKLNIQINVASSRGHKYNYLPYGMILTDSRYSTVLDETFSYPNKKNYSTPFFVSEDYERIIDNYSSLSLDDESNTSSNEQYSYYFGNSSYSDFVDNYYTQLPEDGSLDDLKSAFSDTINSASKADIYDALNIIRDAIQKDTKYTLSPGKTPSNRDFVSYFLLENHQGYCSHFASAGVVLCRMAGIPARYNEGYVVLEDDFSQSNKVGDNNYRIGIQDNRAHAWAEIYLHGIGWVPFEFTPGYTSNQQSNDETTSQITAPPITTTTVPETTTTPEEVTSQVVQQTTTITTVPPQTDIGNTTQSSNNMSSQGSDNETSGLSLMQKAVIYTLICIVAIIILSVTAIYMRYNFNTNKRIRSFKTNSTNTNTLNIYSYIKNLLVFTGVTQNSNTHHLEFIKQVSDTTKFISSTDIDFVIHKSLEASLSNKEISIADVKEMQRISKILAENIFNSLSKSKQLYMKYIKNLI